MRGIFLSALLFASAAFGESLIAPIESQPLLIKSVHVVGTSTRVELKTQVGQVFDDSTIQSDVQRLWATGRFDDIRVEREPQDGGTAVIFNVVEMPQYLLHELHVAPSTFGLQMSLPEGTPITRLRAHQIAFQAEESLRADGFRNATVDYDIVPFLGKKVDLHLNIDAGERVRVKQVTFAGNTAFDPKELHSVLHALKIKRYTPPIPGIWNGWISYPGYSPDGVQSDMSLLRSFYMTKGYYDAQVKLDDVSVAQKAAHVKIEVDAGHLYHVRSWELSGPGLTTKIVHPPKELMRSSKNFCSTLFVARRDAERQGILDFTANVQVQPTADSTEDAPEADLAATIDKGSPYHIGRINFTGNRHFSEAAVRSNFLLDEGDLLDEHLLRKSMARLNESNLFQPVDEHSVILRTDSRTHVADIDVRLTEKKRGSWNLSGPVGPANIAGPLEASISSRLPSWGSGLFELSTYTVSLSLFAFVHPIVPGLPKIPFMPISILQRPYTPGAGWLSGFMIVPQIGWQYMVLDYAINQLNHRLTPILQGERSFETELPVTVATPRSATTMICEPPAPRMYAVRNALALMLRFAGAVTSF